MSMFYAMLLKKMKKKKEELWLKVKLETNIYLIAQSILCLFSKSNTDFGPVES